MDSLQDILSGYGGATDPAMSAIKQYVYDRFKAPVSVARRGDSLVITVPGASLANTLRLQSLDLQKAARTDKRLVFRIG